MDLDHFAGVGSTVIGAIKNKRNAMGIEKEKEYYEIANKRIKDLKEGTLKIRPINKPTGKDKVAQIPKEWAEFEFVNTNFAELKKSQGFILGLILRAVLFVRKKQKSLLVFLKIILYLCHACKHF